MSKFVASLKRLKPTSLMGAEGVVGGETRMQSTRSAW